MSVTVGSGDDVIIEIPSKDEKDWADLIRTQCFAILAGHTHAGTGQGQKIGPGSLESNAITSSKIRLENDAYLRARNVTNSADINLIKANTSNDVIIGDTTPSQNTYVNSPTVVLRDVLINGDTDAGSNDISTTGTVNAGVVNAGTVDADLITTPASVVEPVSADPGSPLDGQIQYSDGTARAQGLWQYQTDTWISVQGEVGTNSVNTTAIQDDAVTTAKIADNSITTDKIADGAVTQDKRVDLNFNESSLIDTGSLSATSATNVVNGSVTITTTGRPVFIGLKSTTGNVLSQIRITNASSVTSRSAKIAISTNATPSVAADYVYCTNISAGSATSGSSDIGIPSSSINTVITLTAGTYTFYLSYQILSGNGRLSIDDSIFYAYEL